MVKQEIHIAREERDRVQHRSGAEGADGLPEWAERALKCVELVEAESPGVGISVDEFGRVLKGLGRMVKAGKHGAAVSQKKDQVARNSTRIEMAVWLAVALSCAGRWCGAKRWKRVEMSGAGGAQEDGVPHDTDSAQYPGSTATHGAPLSERRASSGGKRQRREEMLVIYSMRVILQFCSSVR